MKIYVKAASALNIEQLKKSPYFETTDFEFFEEDDYSNDYTQNEIDRLLKFMKAIEYLDGAEHVSCDLQFKEISVDLDARAAQSIDASDLLKYQICDRSHDFGIRCYNFDVSEYYGDGLMTFGYQV